MNTSMISTRSRLIRRLPAFALFLLPSLALAHPGHYHPGEEDEFDALRASFLHLHGSLEIGVACLAVAGLLVFMMSRKRPVRLAAAAAVVGAVVFLGTF